MLRSVAEHRFLPLWIDVAAPRSPNLHAGIDVGKCKMGTKLGGDPTGPRHSFVTTGPKIDRAKDVAYRKLLRRRFFHVGTGPNRALGSAEYFRGHGAQQKLIEGVAIG